MKAGCVGPSERPSTAEKVAALEAWLRGDGRTPVQLRETSMAWVLLTPDLVYKMKKPVRRRIFDFTRLAQRHRACIEEVRLNRRLAPNVYLGLSRLTRAPDGTTSVDGAGETVEWLVRMRRLPEARFLDRALGSGTATRGDIAAVAARLAAFHRAAPAAALSCSSFLGRYRGDLRETDELLDSGPFAGLAAEFRRLLDALRGFLDQTPGRLMARFDAHRIVEGHGDLRPEHVWLGPPVLIIDCLEASRPLRLLDPFEEYANLAMECAVLNADWVAEALIDDAARALGDDPGARLIAFYAAHRATLRARQALAHLLPAQPRTPEKWRPLARRYLDQAARAATMLETPAVPPANRSHGAAGWLPRIAKRR